MVEKCICFLPVFKMLLTKDSIDASWWDIMVNGMVHLQPYLSLKVRIFQPVFYSDLNSVSCVSHSF